MLRLCIFAVFLAVGLHFGYEAWQTYTQQRGVLFTQLAPYAVPNITHDGIEYTITDVELDGVSVARQNKLLRLAYFATVMRIDPLLALPGVDLEVFYAAIGELERSQERIASVYSSEETKDLILTSLYPISFLKSLHDLEQLRRQVIGNPSFSDAEAYQQQFAHTYKLYRETMTAFQYAIEEHIPDEVKESIFSFHTGYSDVEFFANTLKKYQDGIAQVYKMQRNRFRCYEGKIKYCSEIVRPQLPSIVSSIVSDEYKDTILQHQAFVKAFREEPYRGYSHPYARVELSTSRCGDQGKPGYYYPWWREDDSGLSVFRPELLHEIFFYDLWHGWHSEWEYAKAYRALGGPQYLYQSIANHYVCPDLGLDMTTMLSMLYVAENKLRLSPVGLDPQPEIDTLIDAVTSAYYALPDSQHLTQVTIESYITALHVLLTSVSEPDLYEYIGPTTTQALHDLVTVYYARTASLPDVLMSLVSNNEAVADYALYGTPTGLPSLLLLQTAPMVLYGGFTPTIQPRPYSFVREFTSEPPDIVITLSNLEIADITAFIHKLWESQWVIIAMSASVGTIYPTNPPN